MFGVGPEADAGVVEGEGQGAPVGDDGVDHGLYLVGAGHIALEGNGVDLFLVQFVGNFFCQIQPQVDDSEGGTGLAQPVGKGAADPLAAAGDQGNPSVETEPFEDRCSGENRVVHSSTQGLLGRGAALR